MSTTDGFVDGLVAALETWAGDGLTRPGMVLLALAATLLIDLAQRFVFSRIASRSRATRHVWDDALAGAAAGPVSIIVWALGLSVAVIIFRDGGELPYGALLKNLQSLAIIFAITWFAVRFASHAENGLYDLRSLQVAAERGHLDRSTVQTAGRLLRAVIVITGVIVAMHTLGVNIVGILAFGGIGGIAIGLAARDMLSNIFGGLSVFMDRPFSEGDWISSPDKDIEGTVESIGWRLSVIRRADKTALYVPNAIFLTVPVCNVSRMSARRFDKRISIRFDDVRLIPDITREIRANVEKDTEVDAKQGVNVALEEFSASGATIRIIAFSLSLDFVSFTQLQQRLLLIVERVLEVHGARLAYPTTTFDVPDGIPPLHPEVE